MKKQFFRKWILILAVFAPFAAMASAKMIPAEKWSITAGGNPDELIKFAAEELQELLALRIRKKIPILQSAKLPGSPVIHLGKLDKNLEHEAFSITRKGDVIFITGGTPIGTLYGVYEFLQRYCDIWSVAPGFTYAPGTPLAFGEVNITLTPAIKRRQLYHTGSVYGLRQNRIDWGNFDRRNRLPLPYADKRYRPHLPPGYWQSTIVGTASHSFYDFVPPKKYAKTHPEYYSLNKSGIRDSRANAGGQLCLSNKDVEKIVFDHLIDSIKKDRQMYGDIYYPTVYDFSQMDNTGYLCYCKECKKIIDKYGKVDSGLMVWFINKIARKLKVLYPDVMLRTFAYVNTEPLPKGIRVEDNVIIQLCDLYGESNHTLPVTHPINKKRAELTKGWGKIARNLMIWDYILQNGDQPVIPVDAIASDVKFYKKCNVKWIFMESSMDPGNPASFVHLKNFLIAQLYFNPDQDLDKLLDVYCKGVFGAAHKEMRTYLEKLRTAQNTNPTSDLHAWHRRELKHLTLPFLRECKEIVVKAEKINKDPKIAINILREKNVLDNALNSMLSAYPQFAEERKAILSTLLADRLKVLYAHGVSKERTRLLEERVRLPIAESMLVFTDIPEELKKYPPGTLRFLGSSRLMRGGSNGKYIKDPDSKMERVLLWQHSNPAKYTKKMNFGTYDNAWHTAASTYITASDDEKYHWYKIVRFSMGPSSIVFGADWHLAMNLKGFFIVSDGIKMDEDPNQYELYLSIKFQGPAYKKGSVKPNGILLERGILVPISKKLGNYTPPGKK